MKKLILLTLFILPDWANAQLDKLWECYYVPANDTLDIQGTQSDVAGNLYIFGSEGRNLFIQKVNAEGDIEWTVKNNILIASVPGDPQTQNSQILWAKVTNIAPVDFDSSIVITGKVKFASYWNQLIAHSFIIKLASGGDTSWSIIYNNPNLIQKGLIREESNPQILVKGTLAFHASLALVLPQDGGIGNQDILISVLDANSGTLIKHKNFSSRPVISEFFDNLTLNDKYLYVSGSYYINSGWATFITKLDTSLERISDSYESNRVRERNFVIEHAVDDVGNMYLLVNKRDSSRNYMTSIGCIKYNAQGDKCWQYDYNVNATSSDSSYAFKVSKGGIIRISGQSNSNKSIFLVLDSSGNNLNILLRDNVQISHYVTTPFTLNPSCPGCLPARPYVTKPAFNLENSSYYFNQKNQTAGLSKAFDNTRHWWDVDTTRKSDDLPYSIVFSDTFDFVSVFVIDTLSEKKIRYVKYRDTSWLKVPINVTAMALSANAIRLNWETRPDYRNGFVIERSIDGIQFNPIDTVSKDSFTFMDQGLVKETIYYYRLNAMNTYGVSPSSVITFDTTWGNIGINTPSNFVVKVYPNPVQTDLFIEGDFDIAKVEIKSVTGKTVATYINPSQVSFKELPPGIYFIQINKTYTYKILKL